MLQMALGGSSSNRSDHSRRSDGDGGSDDSGVDIGLPGGLRGMLTPAYLTAGQFAPAFSAGSSAGNQSSPSLAGGGRARGGGAEPVLEHVRDGAGSTTSTATQSTSDGSLERSVPGDPLFALLLGVCGRLCIAHSKEGVWMAGVSHLRRSHSISFAVDLVEEHVCGWEMDTYAKIAL